MLEYPLAQDGVVRKPIASEGNTLDTKACCPALTAVEEARFQQLLAIEKQRIAPEANKKRAIFIKRHAEDIAQRANISIEQARIIAEKQAKGILCPSIALHFDDPELRGMTVADVLADPERFVDATLADPIEGIAYGPCKAKVMLDDDSAPFIHSFAHGGAIHQLRYNFKAAQAVIEGRPSAEAAKAFVDLIIAGSLDDTEIEKLRAISAERSGSGKRTLDRALNNAREERRARQAETDRRRQAAERQDPRPQIPVPTQTAEWIPQMDILNEVLGSSRDPEPPMRDDEGVFTAVRLLGPPLGHLLTPASANEEETEEARLPAPEQPILARLSEEELAEVIERHIEYVAETRDGDRYPVHLSTPFVKHFLQRSNDQALPTVRTIATMPFVLPKSLFE